MRKIFLFPLTLYLGIIVAFAWISYKFLLSSSATDFATYQELVQQSRALRAEAPLKKEATHKIGKEVTKNIWTTKEGKPLQLTLYSDLSHFILTHKKGKVEISEQLTHLKGSTHDLDNNRLTSFHAQTGTYHFPTHSCTADMVYIEEPDKRDHWLKADRIVFDWATQKMIAFSPEGFFSKNHLCYSSSFAEVSFMNNLSSYFVIANGDIRLNGTYRNKQSLALADSASYQSSTKTLLLESRPDHRVLFSQEGIELSAPKVRISPGLDIHGIGDVRFVLSGEEKEQLEELITKYL